MAKDPKEKERQWFDLDIIPVKGHSTWFHVESRSNGEPHLVRLEDKGGNGSCECQHFIYRCEGKLEQTRGRSMETRCAHILAAMMNFAQIKIDQSRSE